MNNSRQNTRLRWRDAAKLENLAGELIDTTAEGNVQFGKNIEVDGNIIVNGSDNIVDKEGNPVITGGGVSKDYVDAADQKLQGEINTKQDALTTEQLAAVNSGITSAKITELEGKQNALTQTQLDATNSGITSVKVATYDGYATGKQDTLTAGTNITIENNVISATGGGANDGFTFIDITNYVGELTEEQYNTITANWPKVILTKGNNKMYYPVSGIKGQTENKLIWAYIETPDSNNTWPDYVFIDIDTIRLSSVYNSGSSKPQLLSQIIRSGSLDHVQYVNEWYNSNTQMKIYIVTLKQILNSNPTSNTIITAMYFVDQNGNSGPVMYHNNYWYYFDKDQSAYVEISSMNFSNSYVLGVGFHL